MVPINKAMITRKQLSKKYEGDDYKIKQ